MILAAILITACATDSTTEDQAIIKGYVYYLDQYNGPQPIDNALVYASNILAQARTEADGSYQLSFEPQENEMNVDIVASKAGYQSATAAVYAVKGQTVEAPDFTLQPLSEDTTVTPIDSGRTSGDPAHIELYGKQPSHVYIKSSGLTETAMIQFVVRDAEGIPVDDDHRAFVEFTIANGPGGGEYLFPDTMTSRDGIVYTILNSGTIAGAVQILARTTLDGEVIETKPIKVAIYGGLPDQRHFSLALERVNIAGRVHYGILDRVTAFVGDKYSNPVAPGTVVYFSSDYSIVEGAAETDAMGRATVNFMSAGPLPPDPANNPYARITAHTFSDTLTNETITSQIKLLLSGHTAPIEISPQSFEYDNTNTPVRFDYSVHDVWGHPLVGGTQISVSATDGQLYGDIDVDLLDTQSHGPGSTDFGFTWAPGDSLQAPQVYIDITVMTPENGNGNRSTSILGTKSSE